MENPQAAKPPSVVLGVNLLWGALALGVLRLLLESGTLFATPKLMMIAGSFALALALYAFLIVKISAGRNWARITFLVLALTDLVLSGPGMVSALGRAPLGAIVALAGSGLQLGGLAVLFIGPGKSWFGRSAP